jgi:hypothetical protein
MLLDELIHLSSHLLQGGLGSHHLLTQAQVRDDVLLQHACDHTLAQDVHGHGAVFL